MNLDPLLRSSLADAVLGCLEDAAPGSEARLCGSLADGRADEYSDIDISWEVPDELFASRADGILEDLSKVCAVASLRPDPDLQNSEKHRLIFVQFAGAPLFWRVDIGIFAKSIHRDSRYDLNNNLARGSDWSHTHSALMNAIAAVKALLRGNEAEAHGLLRRAFERIGRSVPKETYQNQILLLAEQIGEIDREQVDLARQVQALHREVFRTAGG